MRAAHVVLASSLLVACAEPATDELPSSTSEQAVHATHDATTKTQKSNPLVDHGGTVLATSTTYAIYWGTPADFPSDLQTGMTALLSGLPGSSYLGIAQQYMRGAAISQTFGGTIVDTSAAPKSAPNAAGLAAEVCKLIPQPDPNAVYIVFTSNAPSNANYCAWHNKATASCNGLPIQVAYVPNQALIPHCSPYTVNNLHCNSYTDGTVSSFDSVAHEVMEAITDAQIDAWYDANKAEIADKCEYQYLGCVNLPTGSFQIQPEWSNALGGCQQQ
jgi:serine protease